MPLFHHLHISQVTLQHLFACQRFWIHLVCLLFHSRPSFRQKSLYEQVRHPEKLKAELSQLKSKEPTYSFQIKMFLVLQPDSVIKSLTFLTLGSAKMQSDKYSLLISVKTDSLFKFIFMHFCRVWPCFLHVHCSQLGRRTVEDCRQTGAASVSCCYPSETSYESSLE